MIPDKPIDLLPIPVFRSGISFLLAISNTPEYSVFPAGCGFWRRRPAFNMQARERSGS